MRQIQWPLVLDTGPYNASRKEPEVKRVKWTHLIEPPRPKHDLWLVGCRIWAGMDYNEIGDMMARVRLVHANGKEWPLMEQSWDRYAQPSGVHDTYRAFPGYYVLSPGMGLLLESDCQPIPKDDADDWVANVRHRAVVEWCYPHE